MKYSRTKSAWEIQADASRGPTGTIPGKGYETPSDGGWRDQGTFKVPHNQGKMDKALHGQVLYCMQCGTDHKMPLDCRLQCKCGALYTLTAGVNMEGNVVIVRMDRWR